MYMFNKHMCSWSVYSSNPVFRCVRQTLKYDPFVGRWRDCANMKVARANHTATAFNSRLFVIGMFSNI